MSDEEDADANEQAFAELQENLQEQEEAENEANRLNELKLGDADYDAIRAHYVKSADPDADTCKELAALTQANDGEQALLLLTQKRGPDPPTQALVLTVCRP